MIFTVGYQRLTPDTLAAIAEALDAVVIDLRAKAGRCKSGFGKRQLAMRFGGRYQDRGHDLGGYGNTTAAGIASLAPFASDAERNVLLLCAEEAPGECHRHHAITGQHYPQAIHIFRDELLLSGDLARTIATGAPYPIIGNLAEILDAAKPGQLFA